jgi:hypothetical protein
MGLGLELWHTGDHQMAANFFIDPNAADHVRADFFVDLHCEHYS